MNTILNLRQLAQRVSAFVIVVGFALGLICQLLPAIASAAQITSRSMTMSTSAISTAATYTLSFTPVSSAQELIVDFCSNDPLVSDTCSFAATTVPTISSPPPISAQPHPS